jgi:hypothetical protein
MIGADGGFMTEPVEGSPAFERVPVLAGGYAEPAAYLRWYEQRNGSRHALSAQASLDLWQRELPAGWLAARLGPSPRCLIEGCASTNNVTALLGFLWRQGVPRPQIDVIDLIDLPAFGALDARARFHQADAGDLSGLYGDGSIDLVLQDHMMNCAPVARYGAILGELSRVLRAGGLAMLNYTDPSAFPAPRGTGLERRLGLEGDLAPALTGLSAAERLICTDDGFIAVTLPLGNLEYFIPFEALAGRLAEAGLRIEALRLTEGLDHNAVDGDGLACRRHHCLLVPCPR